MIIKGINVKNRFINFKNAYFDFSSNGIYQIIGENGTGKTSFMKKIVFGKYEVEFNDLNKLKLWNFEREKLFSYSSQNISYCNLYVYEYISMGNKNITKQDVTNYFSLFNLDLNILNFKFQLLSGGEKKKIQIITSLLKNTPYLFLDEPTNNLDDSTTLILKDILLDYSKNHTIILITHDNRLNFDCKKYELKDNKIIVHDNFNNHNKDFLTETISVNNKFIYRNYLKMIKNKPSFITFIIILSILIGLSIYSNYQVKSIYNFDDVSRPNIILVQSLPEYDNILDNYIIGEKLTINEELKEETYINLDDIKEIYNLNGVSKIYLTDRIYQNEIYEKLNNMTLSESLNYVSCPKEYYEDFYGNSILDYGLEYIDGNYPKDNEYEVSISKNLLKTFFGYNDDTVMDAIGQKITLNINDTPKEYEIVAFSYFDLVQVSYHEEYNLGVYCFNENNFDKYKSEQILYDESEDAYIGMIKEAIILTNDGYERTVLNHLISNYPCGLYDSNHYDITWQKQYNSNRYVEILIPNLIMSFIFSIGLIFINIKCVKHNYSTLKIFENYYIKKYRIKIIFIIITILEYLLCLGLGLIINLLFYKHSFVTNNLIIFNFLIMFIPLIILHFIFSFGEKNE